VTNVKRTPSGKCDRVEQPPLLPETASQTCEPDAAQATLKKTSAWLTPWRIGASIVAGTLAIGSSLITTSIANAQSVVLPQQPNLFFQTNGPASCVNIGDWYTTAGNAGGPNCPTPPPAPGATVGTGTDTNNPPNNRLHRSFISVTADDLATGAVTISVLDAESNGALDQVNASNPGTVTCTAGNAQNCDPTRFTLRTFGTNGTDGVILSTVTVPAATGDGFRIDFPAITTPGVYVVTSETGDLFINGGTSAVLNDDQNSFEVQVTGGSANILIGQFQGSLEFAPGSTGNGQRLDFPLYFLTGPGTGSLFLRNFDLDGPTILGVAQDVDYISPLGGIGTRDGTISLNSVWNGGPGVGTLNTGGDLIPGLNAINDAGIWTIDITIAGNNQTIFEANTGDNPAARLPLFDVPPQRAGNFVITPDTERQTTIGAQVCHPFTVTNFFFTTDIINLALQGTDPNYTVQIFRDPNGNGLLDANEPAATDTDGDGVVDTGILQPNQTVAFILCVTPGPNATGPDTTVISGTSFMDREVRIDAANIPPSPGQPPLPPPGPPVPQTVTKVTTIPLDASLQLVKRITNITRGGSSLGGVPFNQFINDPNSANDDSAGWNQFPPVGQISIAPPTVQVASGDEITYTVYFLAEGNAPVTNVNICDLIPEGTTLVAGSGQIQQANNAAVPGGTEFSSLAPLPAGNSCSSQNNSNGAIIYGVGTVPNTAGSNFGFVRFRVRIN